MLFLSLLFLLGAPPEKAIKLDNRGVFLGDVGFSRAKVMHDGSFLVMTNYSVWHWDTSGKLITKFGSKGQGPGEFGFVGEVVWNGDLYWVVDLNHLTSSVFDRRGEYLYRKNIHYRQIFHLGKRLFCVDSSHVDRSFRNYPPVLQELEYQISNKDLVVKPTSLLFRKVTRRQMDFSYNFKLLWLAENGDKLLVVDQLEPKINIYDPAALKQEKNTPLSSTFDPPAISMQLTRWVDPPKSLTTSKASQVEFRRWWNSWSRISYFGKLGTHFVVGYEVPNPQHPEDSLQVIQKLGPNGRAVGPAKVLDGVLMGTLEGNVYVLEEDDSQAQFSYFVKILNFQ